MFWPRNRGEGATRPSENKGGYWAAIYRREEMDRRCWPCWVFIGERERDVIYLSFFSRIFSPFFVHVTLSLSLSLSFITLLYDRKFLPYIPFFIYLVFFIMTNLFIYFF
jgi:hypothetical protein